MHKAKLLALLVFAGLSLKAQYAGYKLLTDLTTLKTQFAEASQKIHTIKSDFVQEKNLSMLSEKIISKGKFWFKKDNLVCMEYSEPFQYLRIIIINNVFIKEGQTETKISTPSNKSYH